MSPGMTFPVQTMIAALALIVTLAPRVSQGQEAARRVSVAEALTLIGKNERVTLTGTLLFEVWPGHFYLHDGTGTIRGQIVKPLPMKPGDRIEVTGVPMRYALAPGEQLTAVPGVPWMDRCTAVRLGSGRLPEPVAFDSTEAYRDEASRQRIDGQLVRVRGRVTCFDGYRTTYIVDETRVVISFGVLVITDEKRTMRVLYKPKALAPAAFHIGAQCEFTGVCRLEGKLPAKGGRQGTIEIFLPEGHLARVLDQAPLWERRDLRQQILIGAASLGVVALGILAWMWRQRLKVTNLRKMNIELEQRVAARTAELERALAQQTELASLKTNFVSLVSHEFRTPLGVIMSATDVLRRYFDRLPQDKRERHLDMIFRSTKNLALLIDEVLLVGRVEEGRVSFTPQPVDLDKFLPALTDELRSATGAACHISFRALTPLGGAVSDEGLLRHIISNLLSNAVKYSEPGTPVEFTAAREAGELILTVRDHGIGIPKEDQSRLFTSFTRGSNVGERQGTGLGLVVVQRCVELHGGTIILQSKAGDGTTVTVRIPVFAEG